MSYEGTSFVKDIQKTNSVRIFGSTIWVKKRFVLVVFLQVWYFSNEHFNGSKMFHGRLNAWKIYSCVKFIHEKSRSKVFIKSTSAKWGPIDGLPLKQIVLRKFTFYSEAILISNNMFKLECQQYRLIIMCLTGTLNWTFLWSSVTNINKIFEIFSAHETLIH